MTDVALEHEDVERRRRGRARELALVDIPLIRAIGSLFLILGVYLNNSYLAREGAVLRPWWWVAAALAVYAIFSWVAVRVPRYVQK